MHNGDCYPNGSYFWDRHVYGEGNSIKCVLPNSDLDDGEWVTPSGSSVNCTNATGSLRCNFASSPASIGLYRTTPYIPLSDEGWFKCCLPLSCSDPTSEVIFANIFSKCFHCTYRHRATYIFTVGWAQIENITVDLPSDITVLPQTYTLHAIKTGEGYNNYFLKSANWYFESVTPKTKFCSGHKYTYNCTVGNEQYTFNVNSYGKYDFILNVTWNEENTTNGKLGHIGDHVYRFYLEFGYKGNVVNRNRQLTVSGK